MANLRTKLYFLILAVFFLVAGNPAAYAQDSFEDSPVITQGVQAAEDGINYWASEKEKANDYWTPETKIICLNMLTRAENQLIQWTAELDKQVTIGSKYVVHSASYWQAKKYLGWAKDALEGVKVLYDKTKIRELKFIIAAMEQAIEIAEKIVALFNK